MSIEIIATKAGTHIESFIFRRILANVTERILKRDPFKCAIEQSLDELRNEKSDNWVILEDIYSNREKIFDKIEIADETTFRKILAENGIEPKTSSILYKKLNEKYIEIINTAAKEKTEVFFPYVIQEFKKIGADNKETIRALSNLAQNEKIHFDSIIEKLEKLEKEERLNYLFKIESELKKGKVKEGKFFRNEGPLWIDFEEGYVIKRDEVNKIKDTFKSGSQYIMLVGGAASGKSVIARNIGFELAEESDVFYINSKIFETHKVDTIFESILKLKGNTLVIIEDVHLYPEHCSDLIKQLSDKETDIKILFTARPTYNRLGITSSNLDLCKEFKLEAFDSADSIIKKYAEKKGLPQPSEEELEMLKNQSTESLWVLAYFLMAWEQGKTIEINQVYKKVHDDLRGLDNKYKINGAHYIILALAPFYQFEIQVEKPFLIQELGLYETTIQKLIDAGEIKENNGFLSLHHSTLAELYIKACERYHDLVDSLFYKLKHLDFHDEENYTINMFQYYLRCKPKNYYDILGKSSSINSFFGNMSSPINSFFGYIFKDEKTCNAIRELLSKEPDVEKIGWCIRNIASVCSNVGKALVNDLDLNNLKSKIEIESNFEKIGWCIWMISSICSNVGKALVNDLDLNNLKSKIEKEPDIAIIGIYVSYISKASGEVGKALVEIVKSKIEMEPDLELIGICMVQLSVRNNVFGEAVLESIDLNNLKSKIERESYIKTIGDFMFFITFANRKLGKALYGILDLNIIREKIEKESDIETIREFVHDISITNSEMGKSLAEVLKAKL